MAPAATLLDGLGSPMVWWAAAVLLLLAGCLLLVSRPRLSVALAVAGGLALGIASNGLVDDAYIQFRYASNLADGHGPVFNRGERVEGASGGSWIAVIALVRAVTGADAARAGRLLSLVFTVAAVLAAAACGRVIAGTRGAAVAALLWAALPTPALYAATGLETAAFALALWVLGAALAGGRSWPAGAFAALAATLRPEGIVLAVGALPFWRRLGRAGRAALACGLAASALIAGARYVYYGLPVPHSAVVKGITAAAGISTGLAYLAQAAFEWWPLLLVLPWIARHVRRLLPALVPAMMWTVLVTLRGGDWMPGGRYLLPLAIILIGSVAAAAGEGAAPGPPSPPRLLARSAVFISVAWGLLLLAPLEKPSSLPPGRSWRAMAEHRVQSRWWEALGAWLKGVAPPGARLAAGPIGALPYASRLTTFDMYGLCSPVTHTRDGDAGHRLWGLREAVEAGTDAVYPGQRVPQADDWNAVLAGARLHVQDVPDFEERFRPLGIDHAPEYHLDILRDVVWIRTGASGP
jgi:arabinofuranosyltransferase